MKSYSVSYTPKTHCVEITFRGVLDMSTVEKSRSEVAKLVKQHHCFSVLADLRECTSSLSTFDIFEQPQRTSEKLAAEGFQTYQFKRALVVEHEVKNASFFETVAINRGHNVRLFHDLEEARRWLSEG